MKPPGEIKVAIEVFLAVVVARAGCSDSLGWWDDESLTEAGLFSLKRLFPRSYRAAALRLALQAARRRHEGILGRLGFTGARHLFSQSDPGFGDVGIPDSESLPPTTWTPIPDRETLRARLETVAGQLPALSSEASVSLEGLIDLSAHLPGPTAGPRDIARTLASAYLLGDKGKLVLPFVRGTE